MPNDTTPKKRGAQPIGDEPTVHKNFTVQRPDMDLLNSINPKNASAALREVFEGYRRYLKTLEKA